MPDLRPFFLSSGLSHSVSNLILSSSNKDSTGSRSPSSSLSSFLLPPCLSLTSASVCLDLAPSPPSPFLCFDLPGWWLSHSLLPSTWERGREVGRKIFGELGGLEGWTESGKNKGVQPSAGRGNPPVHFLRQGP